MYLDHRVIAKIARTLDQIDMSALLLDANGSVLVPEGDHRQFTLPEELRQAPTTPLIYSPSTSACTATATRSRTASFSAPSSST